MILFTPRRFYLDFETPRQVCVPQHLRFHSASQRDEMFPSGICGPRVVGFFSSFFGLTRALSHPVSTLAPTAHCPKEKKRTFNFKTQAKF